MTDAQHWLVEEHEVGDRLDVALAARTDISRSSAARWLALVVATINGEPAKRSYVLAPGLQVDVPARPDRARAEAPPMPPVRFRDEHMLVVAKPPGLVVHPGAAHYGDTLVDAMVEAGIPLSTGTAEDRPGIVHRLDRDTSGLLMVASDDAAQDNLIEQLRQRTVDRRYFAIVRGAPPSTTGTVDAPIARHPTDRQRFACVEGGRHARTHWTTLQTVRIEDATLSLVECRLETGRTHQIRVHMQAIGNPVLGDTRYGQTVSLDARLGVPRLALHAAMLGFTHPVSGERVELHEDLAADLQAVLDTLGIDTD